MPEARFCLPPDVVGRMAEVYDAMDVMVPTLKSMQPLLSPVQESLEEQGRLVAELVKPHIDAIADGAAQLAQEAMGPALASMKSLELMSRDYVPESLVAELVKPHINAIAEGPAQLAQEAIGAALASMKPLEPM